MNDYSRNSIVVRRVSPYLKCITASVSAMVVGSISIKRASSVGAQSVTVKPIGCGFDPLSKR